MYKSNTKIHIMQFFKESKPAYLILTVSVTVTVTVLLILLINYLRMKTAKNPVTGNITSGFGTRKHPVTGVISEHNGVDIAVPIGTPIKSPLNGTVAQINTHATGGKQIIIKHTNGYKTGYAHLFEYAQGIVEGKKILQGEVVAFSGNSGKTTGPHLHFTLTNPMGVKVDPALYFDFKS